MFKALDLPLPYRSWPFWIVAILLPVGLAGMAFIYYDLLLRSGTLDSNADSIAIPIFSTVAAATIISPFVFITTAACLWRYPGGGSLLNWDAQRRVRSAIISTIFGLPAAVMVVLIFPDFFQVMPWYEYLWALNAFNFVIWLLMMRSASITRRN
jgi:hypothetical protein